MVSFGSGKVIATPSVHAVSFSTPVAFLTTLYASAVEQSTFG